MRFEKLTSSNFLEATAGYIKDVFNDLSFDEKMETSESGKNFMQLIKDSTAITDKNFVIGALLESGEFTVDCIRAQVGDLENMDRTFEEMSIVNDELQLEVDYLKKSLIITGAAIGMAVVGASAMFIAVKGPEIKKAFEAKFTKKSNNNLEV